MPFWTLIVVSIVATVLCCVAARVLVARHRWMAVVASVVSGVAVMPAIFVAMTLANAPIHRSVHVPDDVLVVIGWIICFGVGLLFAKASWSQEHGA